MVEFTILNEIPSYELHCNIKKLNSNINSLINYKRKKDKKNVDTSFFYTFSNFDEHTIINNLSISIKMSVDNKKSLLVAQVLFSFNNNLFSQSFVDNNFNEYSPFYKIINYSDDYIKHNYYNINIKKINSDGKIENTIYYVYIDTTYNVELNDCSISFKFYIKDPDINYENCPEIFYWNGIRKLNNNSYLTCGTNIYNKGILYVGPIESGGSIINNYIISYPGSNITNLYNSEYIGNDIYRLVGIFTTNNANTDNINGFLYEGKLNEFTNKNNYKNILIGNQYTYIHSIMENILIGNYDDIKEGKNIISAFLYIIDINKIINVVYPESITNSVYGIWYNGNNNYTICGSYSNDYIPITDIYFENGIRPVGNAFLVNYDIITNKFSNWKNINGLNKRNILTQFQSINSNKVGFYQVSVNIFDIDSNINIPGWVIINKDLEGNFTVNKWVDINYPLANHLSCSTSVIDDIVVGTHVGDDGYPSGFVAKLLF